MLMLNPAVVKFGSTVLDNVAAVTIDRVPAKDAVEWSDYGPYPVTADVPEQRVTATVRQRLTREDPNSPVPGQSGTLTVSVSLTGTDAARRKVTAVAVVLSCVHEVEGAWGKQQPAAARVIKFVLLSSDGAADPVTVTDAGAEA